ncbi:Integral membrane protein TerC family protein [Oceanibacterium hippocampi]|uniref:Integral membrane protein TerC family protein n=2 Tax=Oceanibacterium hippocampi TaxID=745714 RepID=A0A1Y5S9Q2_9PROT|nr:TerC family protein [Oceanibacterium hippocampi]SLN34554.1 Integral membrane protein TerC family protein [Oceanibacterium hippocampi]
MEWLSDPAIWASLATLTVLEIVLGIDNLVFLSIITQRLPAASRARAQRIGLMGALFMRLALLGAISWIAGLTTTLITIGDFPVSWRDVILGGGGLFLLAKATSEIHNTVEGEESHDEKKNGHAGFAAAIAQIMLLDLVFSLDSVITAVGMTDNLPVMMAAVIIAVLVMLFAAAPVGEFIRRHPTTKMLALSFLLLVGVALIADGLHFHIPRGYLYFAIFFSMLVEVLNLLAARRRPKKPAIGD